MIANTFEKLWKANTRSFLSQEEEQAINPLDVKPGVQVRTWAALFVLWNSLQVIEGKVTDWRGKFGFMSSDQMEGKIFLHRSLPILDLHAIENDCKCWTHSKDFVEGRQLARVGAIAYFQVKAQLLKPVGYRRNAWLENLDRVEKVLLCQGAVNAYFKRTSNLPARQVLHQESSVVGAKAVNVRILEW